MTRLRITKDEYKFLTDTCDAYYGAAYNAVAEYCIENGLITGVDNYQRPLLTDLGREQIKLYLDTQQK